MQQPLLQRGLERSGKLAAAAQQKRASTQA
jgi:hypothetical protein